MSTIHRKHAYREFGTCNGAPLSAYANIILLDLSNFMGYNWGNTGREARGRFFLNSTGLTGSDAPWIDSYSSIRVHLKRSNGGTPTVLVPDGGGPFDIDISGNTLRIRQYVYTTQYATFAEMIGQMIDWTP